jgi:hypothetical protein
MFALISNERELDKTRNHTRDRRNGACYSLNVRDITITTLYTYAKGFNVNRANLIQRDERLARMLPPSDVIVWFGLDHDMRVFLKRHNQSPPKTNNTYQESMCKNAILQIQQVANNYPHGVEALQRILNDD